MRKLKIKISFLNYFLLVFVLLLIVVNSTNTLGQNNSVKHKLCGNYSVDRQLLNAVKNFEANNSNRLLKPTQTILRVYFFICRNSNGSNAAATISQIESEFVQLSADYAVDNIYFINAGIEFIDNTNLNSMDVNDPTDVALLESHTFSNCITVFYHSSLAFGNQIIGGNAYDIPNTYCSINHDNIAQGQTISHEIGHCLGLLHTFERGFFGISFENIDGSNSLISADEIIDTPADPYAYNDPNFPCFSTSSSGCSYNGNCTDPNNSTNFNTPYNNLMAYWWANSTSASTASCYTNLILTLGQYFRIYNYLNITPMLQNCMVPNNVNVGPINVTSGNVLFSSLNNLSTYGAVEISGTSNALFESQDVLLTSGFHADPSIGGNILIKALSYIFPAQRDEIDQDSNKLNEGKSIVMNINPNPVHSTLNIQLDLLNDENISIKIFDLLGKEVSTISNKRFEAGFHSLETNISNFTEGIYFVILQSASYRKEEKIIKHN